MGRMRIRVRGRMGVARVRRWRCPRVEVRMIILIHHLGAAHHPARARHPRAGLPTCVPERCTTRSKTATTCLLHSLKVPLRSRFFSFFFLLPLLLIPRQMKTLVEPSHVHRAAPISRSNATLERLGSAMTVRFGYRSTYSLEAIATIVRRQAAP